MTKVTRADRRFPTTISGQIRWYLQHCGTSMRQVGQASGVSDSILSRFIRDERTLNQKSIDALGEYLGLRVVRDGD